MRASPHHVAIEPQFLRTRDVARLLAISESQVRNYVRAGVLREVRLPGIRAVRFPRVDVEGLAAEWAKQLLRKTARAGSASGDSRPARCRCASSTSGIVDDITRSVDRVQAASELPVLVFAGVEMAPRGLPVQRTTIAIRH